MEMLLRAARLACLLCAPMLGVAIGCSSNSVATSRTVRDSAGVEIIEQPLSDASRRILASEPEIDYSKPGDPAREFFQVSDATLLSDGSTAVLNAGTDQVRIFSRDGQTVTEFGRSGDGPGEFQLPYRVFALTGGRLVVSDPQANRILIFDRMGRFLEGATLPRDERPPRVLGVLDSGQVLLRFRAVAYPFGGFQPQFLRYFAYSWSANALDSIARIRSGTIGHVGAGEPWGVVRGPLFQAEAHGATSKGLAILGNGARSELRFYDLHGVVRRILRWPSTQQPVTAEDLKAYRDALMAEMPSDEFRTMMGKQLDATPVAEHLPVFEDLMVDRDDRIWVKSFVGPRLDHQSWHVFDLDRRTASVIDLPLGVRLFDASGDTLLVLELDDLDVEHVRLYRLVDSHGGEIAG